MKLIRTCVALASLTFASSHSLGADLASTKSIAARLTFDKQCITIDGKDQVIFSGAFHYFRCPKELWADRFRTLKAAGFNTVETYVAWNWHEQTTPANPDDYSKLDMTDLTDWLSMATDQFGFNVILRPGPYICAEWDGGGYPQWLVAKKPADLAGKEWFRGDDKEYLAWCKHWFTAVAKVAAPFQITHRPVGKSGIILWQIENEYNYSDQPIEVKHNQLLFLAHASRDLGIDVPLTTCMTDNSVYRHDQYLTDNVIETRNTYPKFSMSNMQGNIGILDRYQPDRFKMVTELQGGWFSQVGGQLSEAQGFDASHINHVTLFAWEHGFTATNYYMGFGGTNFGDWAASSITTSYDYDAPVRENGGVTERYFAVKALGDFISEHGPNLSRAVAETFTVKNAPDDVVVGSLRRAADGSRYLFVRTEQRKSEHDGTVTLTTAEPNAVQITAAYQLGNFGSKVLYLPPGATSDKEGQWYPKAVDAPKRPTNLPDPVNITEAKMQVDPGPTQWTPIQSDQGEETAGIYNRGFVFYRATVPTISETEGQKIAFIAHPSGRDWAGFELNGKRLLPDAQHGSYSLSPADSGAQLLAIYENYGRPNGGRDMEKPNGLIGQKIIQSQGQPTPLTDWRMKRLQGNARRPAEMSPTTDDSTWSKADISAGDGNLAENESAVYRTSVDLTAEDLKNGTALTLGRVDDDGTIQINGKAAGESHDWAQAQRFDIGNLLKPGKNEIAVLVHNRDGVGGLARGAWLDASGPAIAMNWEISDQSAGATGQWWKNDLDESNWKPIKLDAQNASSEAAPLLSWYRLKFELPTANPHVWVPWKIHLDAIGNGFLYLNGHALGRWWQVGPQRDFYLPECWLNFGPGKTNIFTISLRPTEGVGVRSAQVAPYSNVAEER